MSAPPIVQSLSIKKIRSTCLVENITCKTCLSRSDYLQSMNQHINNLSVRSLKNFLAVRGLRCFECKSKADLQRIAIYGAHLPHRKIVLPSVFIPGLWLFPRVTVKLGVLEAQFQYMLRLIMQGGRRFALLPSSTLGIIARVIKMDTPAAGETEIHIVGEQRFRVDGLPWTLNGTFAQDIAMANGTLFTDSAVPAANASELRALDKAARRAFFWVDTDAWASLRAQSLLGSPPSEADGPEPLSHWLGRALAVPQLQEAMFATNSTAVRLVLARNALDSFRGGFPTGMRAALGNRTDIPELRDGGAERLGLPPASGGNSAQVEGRADGVVPALVAAQEAVNAQTRAKAETKATTAGNPDTKSPAERFAKPARAEQKSKVAAKTEEKSKPAAKAEEKSKPAAKAEEKSKPAAKAEEKSKPAAKAEEKSKPAAEAEEGSGLAAAKAREAGAENQANRTAA
eukprot:CAMPEP_0172173290 /NCGR_PEP_ID=MMETSP1050-20130122/12957_1 /TAXON_ID=233186 /ORGANISM="Cryptomonas curvata, Strain CCAP979/52" /LENGTH=456 /DNA_ID=CAMNT_0012844999 /DNA_START=274 /DNA_END=1641 /DNA_ORIENTATION=+